MTSGEISTGNHISKLVEKILAGKQWTNQFEELVMIKDTFNITEETFHYVIKCALFRERKAQSLEELAFAFGE